MDGPRFDALARSLATLQTRRRALRAGEAAKGGCKAAGKHYTKTGQCCAGLVCVDGACQPSLGGGGCPSGCVPLEDASGADVCADPATAQCGACFEDVDCPAGYGCIPFEGFVDGGAAGADRELDARLGLDARVQRPREHPLARISPIGSSAPKSASPFLEMTRRPSARSGRAGPSPPAPTVSPFTYNQSHASLTASRAAGRP
jgi:hypothetical protein